MIKYVKDICANENALPIAYWINTSSNDIVKNLVGCWDRTAGIM